MLRLLIAFIFCMVGLFQPDAMSRVSTSDIASEFGVHTICNKTTRRSFTPVAKVTDWETGLYYNRFRWDNNKKRPMIRNSDIRKYVDFNSYTESLGWIGYYSRNCNYSNLLMNESICQFIYFFKPIITRFSIVTSLYKFGPKSIKTSQAQVQLMKSGYISDFTSNNITEIEINSDMPLVIFEEPKWDIVRKLSSIIMNNDGDIAGHCFIIFEALNLIVYPHDDTGYGFISNTLNSNSFQIVNNFFKHLDTNKFMYQLKAD